MKFDITTIAALAEQLENCQIQVKDTVMITTEFPGMAWDDAYAIQDAIRLRKVARGSRIIGFKAGLASHAKMKQMGVTSPVLPDIKSPFVRCCDAKPPATG